MRMPALTSARRGEAQALSRLPACLLRDSPVNHAVEPSLAGRRIPDDELEPMRGIDKSVRGDRGSIEERQRMIDGREAYPFGTWRGSTVSGTVRGTGPTRMSPYVRAFPPFLGEDPSILWNIVIHYVYSVILRVPC